MSRTLETTPYERYLRTKPDISDHQNAILKQHFYGAVGEKLYIEQQGYNDLKPPHAVYLLKK